jgi:3-methyladenine DNA glycosylase AlkD
MTVRTRKKPETHSGEFLKAAKVIAALKELSDKAKAKFLLGFFKCGPGEYGQGDHFLGVTVPQSRKVALAFRDLPVNEIGTLLNSKWHEARLTGLLILVRRYSTADTKEKEKLYKFYVSNFDCVNNWDLVDTSAPYLAGPFLFDRYVQTKSEKQKVLNQLLKWAASKNLWERRIAILTTFHFIRKDEFKPTLVISEKLIDDDHDLIHKAVGWMLREVGNRSLAAELSFLDEHAEHMPRTMLRYAIEKFPKKLKTQFMSRSR